MNPIDVIANAIRKADGDHSGSAADLAEVAVAELTHRDIVANAVEALKVDGLNLGLQLGVVGLTDEDLVDIVRTVLRSVRGDL